MDPGTLISELKRRRVFRALIGYGLAAFAVLQIIEPVMHGLHWPDVVLSYVVVALAAGFPVVMALAWVFDVKDGVLLRTPPTPGLRRRYVALALGAIAAVVMAPGLLWYLVWRKPAVNGTAGAATATAMAGTRRIPVGTSPVRGPADAPVTVIEFGDFECPYTRQAESAVRKLFEKYPGKIRLVWKDEPLGVHLQADNAAAFSREVLRQKGQDAFWRVHDALLASYPMGHPTLERIAIEEGLDTAEVWTALRDGRHRTAIDSDIDLAEASGVGGTPWFFVNGHMLDSDDPDLLEQAVGDALGEARQRMAAGVPAGAIYEELQRDAGSAPIPVRRVTLPDPGRRPARGGPPSALRVHQFCDLSTVRCAWAEPSLRRTIASYGDEVRLVWWDISDPQQPQAVRVMKAATAAGNDAFWKMHDAILASQLREHFQEPPPETLSPAALRQLALGIGMDAGVYDYNVALGLSEDERQMIAQARSLDLAGKIVIDGQVYGSFAPPRVWRIAIDRALARRH